METDVDTPLSHNRFRNSGHWTAFLLSDSSLYDIDCYIDCPGEGLSVLWFGNRKVAICSQKKNSTIYAIMSVLMIQKKKKLFADDHDNYDNLWPW